MASLVASDFSSCARKALLGGLGVVWCLALRRGGGLCAAVLGRPGGSAWWLGRSGGGDEADAGGSSGDHEPFGVFGAAAERQLPRGIPAEVVGAADGAGSRPTVTKLTSSSSGRAASGTGGWSTIWTAEIPGGSGDEQIVAGDHLVPCRCGTRRTGGICDRSDRTGVPISAVVLPVGIALAVAQPAHVALVDDERSRRDRRGSRAGARVVGRVGRAGREAARRPCQLAHARGGASRGPARSRGRRRARVPKPIVSSTRAVRCQTLVRARSSDPSVGEETLEGDGMGCLHQQRPRPREGDDLLAVHDPQEGVGRRSSAGRSWRRQQVERCRTRPLVEHQGPAGAGRAGWRQAHSPIRRCAAQRASWWQACVRWSRRRSGILPSLSGITRSGVRRTL